MRARDIIREMAIRKVPKRTRTAVHSTDIGGGHDYSAGDYDTVLAAKLLSKLKRISFDAGLPAELFKSRKDRAALWKAQPVGTRDRDEFKDFSFDTIGGALLGIALEREVVSVDRSNATGRRNECFRNSLQVSKSTNASLVVGLVVDSSELPFRRIVGKHDIVSFLGNLGKVWYENPQWIVHAWNERDGKQFDTTPFPDRSFSYYPGYVVPAEKVMNFTEMDVARLAWRFSKSCDVAVTRFATSFEATQR